MTAVAHTLAHTLPSSVKMEVAVLGNLLTGTAALQVVLAILPTAEVFHLDHHRIIYEAALALHRRAG